VPRKVFVAGEILTAADVNTNLMDQAVMVFDDSAARGSAIPSPSEGMVTYLKDTDAVEKWTGAAWVSVNTDSGKILQVVQSTLTTSLTFAQNTRTTVLSASITPSSTSSKVLIMAQLNVSSTNTKIDFQIDGGNASAYRGTSVGSRSAEAISGVQITPDSSGLQAVPISFLDSPSTTSAITYEIKGIVRSGATATGYINRTRSDSDNIFEPRTASSLILMEVKG
jgi:hypothetical protein